MMFSFSFSKMNVFLLVLSGAWVSTHPLPNGVPSCAIGESAAGSPHRQDDRNPQTGPLNTAGFIVKVGDQILSTATPITLQTNIDYPIVLTSVSGQKNFRGALMILSQPLVATTGLFTLQPEQESKLQISPFCEEDLRSGVTHINNNMKQ
jgi:hypothetical protein